MDAWLTQARDAVAGAAGKPSAELEIGDEAAANLLDLSADGLDAERLRRSFYTTSSCGVCGKGALEAVRVEAKPVVSELRVTASLISALPERLRESQAAFTETGGLHATGLFDSAGE